MYAFSRIVNHRYLSVNSHEIRRRVVGLSERFMADNHANYSQQLERIVENFVTNPLCLNHYEYDIQWKVLHFLLEVSRGPVGALAKQNELPLNESIEDDEKHENNDFDELLISLKQHNITAAKYPDSMVNNESDLSVSHV